MTQTNYNLDSGKWAVAITGRKEWMKEFAIGDGITSATCSLVGRFATKGEAEAIAKQLNDAEPGIMPGGPGAWVYQVLRYRKQDYIGSQNWNCHQRRDCDRRIVYN